MFAILLLSFFKGDSCHSGLSPTHSEAITTSAPSSAGSTVGQDNHPWLPLDATPSSSPAPTVAVSTGLPLSLGVHLFVCFVTFAAMLAWIAVDNSSFNYRFPFKWKLFVSVCFEIVSADDYEQRNGRTIS